MPIDDDEKAVEGKNCTLCGSQAVTFQHENGEWEDPYCSEDCFEIVCHWCNKESLPTPNKFDSSIEVSVCINCGKKNVLDWDEYGVDTLFPLVDKKSTVSLAT